MKQYIILSLTALLFLSVLGLQSCREWADQPDTRLDEEILSEYLTLPFEPFAYPAAIQSLLFPDVTGASGEWQKVALGRVLFYEKALSADGNISCASCHQQELAFSDNVAFSKGVYGNLTDRNSFPIASFPAIGGVYTGQGNIAGDSIEPRGVFWDDRAPDLFAQMHETFENPKEMGISVSSIPDRLEALEYYPILFERAYSSDKITPLTVMESLQLFMHTFVNVDSRYDNALSQAIKEGKDLKGDYPGLTEQENQGKQLFQSNCGSCHMLNNNFIHHEALGSGKAIACNGLDVNYGDQGIGALEGNPELNGVFKVPALRNIAVTGPYMHDGRFETLEDVIQHYNTGIQAHTNLDSLLQDAQGNPKQLNLSQIEIDALIAFLHTLTNDHLLTHEKWSDPFK